MLVSFALGDANFSRHLTQNPLRESVEYRLRWVPNANCLHWPCTFLFCVYISFPLEIGFAFATQSEPNFQWNMDLTVSRLQRSSAWMSQIVYRGRGEGGEGKHCAIETNNGTCSHELKNYKLSFWYENTIYIFIS